MLNNAMNEAKNNITKCDIKNLVEEKKCYDNKLLNNSIKSFDKVIDGKELRVVISYKNKKIAF